VKIHRPLLAILLTLVAVGCHRPRPHDDRGASATAQAAHPETESIHLALGAPTPSRPTDDYLITRPQYAVAYSPSHRGPRWAAWELNRSYFGGAPRHAGHFLPDESLPQGWYRVRHEDYTGSGYDRGHMVRRAG
jgi:endonuclease G